MTNSNTPPPVERGYLALLIGMTLTIVDVPMMAIAMPGIGTEMGLDPQSMALIAGAYPLLVAMLLLPAGRAGDRFGRRCVFLVGGALFVLGTLLSALTTGPLTLTATRMLQGIGGAALAPQALAMIPRLFPPAAQSGAFARLAMTASFALVCGPLVAGVLLVEAPVWMGWRAIFLAEAVVALTVMLLAAHQLDRDIADGDGPRLTEVASFAAIILCLVAPLYVGPAFGWPLTVFVMLAAALPCSALFTRVTARSGPAALVPARLLRVERFRWTIAFLLLAVSAPPGFFVVLTVVLQSETGLSPLQAGVVTAGFPAGVVVGSWIAGRLPLQPISRVAIGVSLLCASFVLVHVILPQLSATRVWPLRLGLLAAGLSMGITVTSVMQLGMSDLPKSLAGAGAGAIQTMQQVCLAASIALSFGLYGQALASRPGVEAASAMLWLQITLTCLATILALTLLWRTAKQANKAKA